MRTPLRIALLALAGLTTVACDKNDSSSSNPATPPANATGNAAGNAATNAGNAAQNAVNNAQNQATAAASSATDTAKQKLAQVADYIGQKKYDLADSTLKEVEGVKSSLPQSLQDQVAALRTQLDTAKAAGSANLPALPGAGK
jgi:hypothetical protein